MRNRLLSVGLFAAVVVAGALVNGQSWASSGYYGSQCASCHGASPTTCAGCHYHRGTIRGATNKTSYTPGETVTVTITSSGGRAGWVRGVLIDHTGKEIARGTKVSFPITFTAPAPTIAGTYAWKVGWYGHGDARGNPAIPDPSTAGHGTETVTMTAFTVTGGTDTTPPTAPTNLASPSKTSTTVSLTWTASTDNVGVVGYDVYRGTALAGSPTTTSYTVTGLAPSTTYSFTVRAKDAAGNVSAPSAALSVTTSSSTLTPVIALSPMSLAFGNVNAGSSSSLTTQIQNIGNAALTVSAITRCSSPVTSTEFTWTSATLPITVSPGYASTLTVSYTPAAAGSDSGCLIITSNASNNTAIQLAVSGTGVTPSGPTISVGASTLVIGNVVVGSSVSHTFTITNTGSGVLNVTIARASGTSREYAFTPASFSLVSNGVKVVVVTYQPTAPGTDNGSLVISSNDSAHPAISVAVWGNGFSNPYPNCIPSTPGHTSDPNCVACHRSNPCSAAAGY